MDSERDEILRKWQDRIRIVPVAYRWLAFSAAAVQIILFTSPYYSSIPPVVLLVTVGVYTFVRMTYPFSWHQNRIVTFSVLSLDVIICFLLVLSTGAIYSPFLLYTLVPVVTSALLLELKYTIGIAGLTGVYVIGSQIWNPFYPIQLSQPELSYFLVYVIAVCLAAFLPYLINANLRQRLEFGDIIRERKRLSREIHDGVAQTVFTLRWQVQLVERRLLEMGISVPEVKELVRLAAEAHKDTRECLEILRTYSGDRRFMPNLQEYLNQFDHNTEIKVNFENGTTELHQDIWTELELLRICKEALTNIRKHAQAPHVQIKFRSAHGRLYISISDDGCGFDAIAYYRNGMQNERHGLSVMQERAKAIGGKFRVLSMPGRGTEVQIEVPANQHRGKSLWLSQ